MRRRARSTTGADLEAAPGRAEIFDDAIPREGENIVGWSVENDLPVAVPPVALAVVLLRECPELLVDHTS